MIATIDRDWTIKVYDENKTLLAIFRGAYKNNTGLRYPTKVVMPIESFIDDEEILWQAQKLAYEIFVDAMERG